MEIKPGSFGATCDKTPLASSDLALAQMLHAGRALDDALDLGPVPLSDDGEVRALTLHDVVPAGHIAVPVTNTRWTPHLRPGEFAILDVDDTEPQPGELYGLMIGTRKGPRLHIVQPYRSGLFAGCDGVMFRFGRPTPGTILAADGPLMIEHWHRTCRGRVVGVLALAEVAHV